MQLHFYYAGTSSQCLHQVRISRSSGQGQGQGRRSKKFIMSVTKYTHSRVVHLQLKCNPVRYYVRDKGPESHQLDACRNKPHLSVRARIFGDIATHSISNCASLNSPRYWTRKSAFSTTGFSGCTHSQPLTRCYRIFISLLVFASDRRTFGYISHTRKECRSTWVGRWYLSVIASHSIAFVVVLLG